MDGTIFTHRDHKEDTAEFQIVSIPRDGYIGNIPALRVCVSNGEHNDDYGDTVWGVVDIPIARIPELITALATSYRELTGEFPLAPKPDTEQEST